MTALTWWYARGIYAIRFSWNTDIILSMLTMALPYGIALFLGVIFFKVDIILLSLMEAPHEADTVTALYSLPMKIVEVGMMYGTIFLNSFLPVLTNTIEEKREDDTKKLALKGFELLMGFGAGISVFLACFAPQILTLISHQNFVETSVHGATAVHAMQIIAWIFLFYFLSSLSNYILIAKNQQKKIIFVNLGTALFNIIGNLILIPLYSFIGAAYVTLASQILLVLINGYLVRGELPPKNTITLGILLTTSALICGYCALLGNQFLHQNFAVSSLFIELAITGIIFGIPYLGIWYLIRKISQKNPA